MIIWRPWGTNQCPSINGPFCAGRRSPRVFGCDVQNVRLAVNPCAALPNTKIAHLCIGHFSVSILSCGWTLFIAYKIKASDPASLHTTPWLIDNCMDTSHRNRAIGDYYFYNNMLSVCGIRTSFLIVYVCAVIEYGSSPSTNIILDTTTFPMHIQYHHFLPKRIHPKPLKLTG